MKTLTPREQKCMIFLKAYVETHGVSPTYEEIAAGIGLKAKSNALYVVDVLVGAGYVRRLSKRPRALELLQSKYHHTPDCACAGCAQARYLAHLKLVHALEVEPPVALSNVTLTGLRKLTISMRNDWLRRSAKPSTQSRAGGF